MNNRKKIKDWIDYDNKLCQAIDKAFEKKEIKIVDKWLKSWEKEDKKDQKHWEKEMIDKYLN